MLATLLDMLPWLRPALSAKLSGVNGFTGRGHAVCRERGGALRLAVRLTGLAGRRAELFINGAPATSIRLNSGRAHACYAPTADSGPLCEGMQLEIRQNGDAVLSGVLSRPAAVPSQNA